MKPDVLKYCFFPKCANTDSRASAIPKIFPGVMRWTPVKEGSKGVREGRRKRDRWEGKEIRE
jgi:hypothetical protein